MSKKNVTDNCKKDTKNYECMNYDEQLEDIHTNRDNPFMQFDSARYAFNIGYDLGYEDCSFDDKDLVDARQDYKLQCTQNYVLKHFMLGFRAGFTNNTKEKEEQTSQDMLYNYLLLKLLFGSK